MDNNSISKKYDRPAATINTLHQQMDNSVSQTYDRSAAITYTSRLWTRVFLKDRSAAATLHEQLWTKAFLKQITNQVLLLTPSIAAAAYIHTSRQLLIFTQAAMNNGVSQIYDEPAAITYTSGYGQ